MGKWEYLLKEIKENNVDEFNNLGLLGWGLCSLIVREGEEYLEELTPTRSVFRTRYYYKCIFKRIKQSE